MRRRAGTGASACRFNQRSAVEETAMTTQRHDPGISNGTNARPLNDTIAQTGPGIPDDAASEGYDPEADAEMERAVDAHLPTAEELFPNR